MAIVMELLITTMLMWLLRLTIILAVCKCQEGNILNHLQHIVMDLMVRRMIRIFPQVGKIMG